MLLKDVFDYSLEEVAELVDSTVGGVKAALNRGRSKLGSFCLHHRRPRRTRLTLKCHACYIYMWSDSINATGTDCVN